MKLQTTKSGNIKIESVNPSMTHYYKIEDVKKAFPFISDFASLEQDCFDLGDLSTNEQMIHHHVMAFRVIY